jgi:two-component system, chemotaxis family, sensor kinase CheA
MDMSQYRELFISESREHLRSISELIVLLEKDAGDREKIDSLFRAAHSIKGMASSMGFGDIAELAHKIEDLMDKVRKGIMAFAGGVADLLLDGADLLEAMILDVEQGGTGNRDIGELVQKIGSYTPVAAEIVASPAKPSQAEPPSPITADKKQEARQTVRVRTEVLDHLINTTGELITNKHRLMNVSQGIGSPNLNDALSELSKLLRELYNEVINVRMMPVAMIIDRFPRMIRDLAKKGGKEVDFEIDGKEIELDRGILEELTDPLIHILRNAVDHGLETPAERLGCGKPAKGRISLTAQREKDQVIIVVEDDGKGMDPEKLIASAIDKGLLTPDKAKQLSTHEALLLTCIPGFSTAKEVTDVSGRGVGMDAVRSTIQSLAGSLAIESEPGQGSRIILKLPLTITIINVLVAEVSSFSVAIPVTNILRTLELRRNLISEQGNQQSFSLDDEVIPLFGLNRILGASPTPSRREFVSLFIAEIKGRKVGLAVDRFLGQQEVFTKPLKRPLAKLNGLAAGAILGDGKVIFILDVANLL